MRIALITILIGFSIGLFAQDSRKLSKCLKKGDASLLASYFNASVDMNLPSHNGIYQKEQASMLIKNFFKKYPPSEFEIKHEGGSKQKSSFQIGRLRSGEMVFRTYILYNSKDGMLQIIELRIEEE